MAQFNYLGERLFVLGDGSAVTPYEIRCAFALIGALNVAGVESWIGYAEAMRRFAEWKRTHPND